MKKRVKKADLTMKTLVTIILLVVGFGIALFIYYQLSGTERVDREVCHQSVIYRATLPAFGGMKEYVPLKCKTQKFCITTGFFGGECEKFKNTGGVVKVKVKDKEQIEKFITQELVDCWSMMGEGKVSVFSQWIAENYGFGSVYPTCVICNRIAFDKTNLEKAGIDLEKIDVLNYMITHAVPDKDISYYDYLIGEGGKFDVSLRPGLTQVKEAVEKITSAGESVNEQEEKELKESITNLNGVQGGYWTAGETPEVEEEVGEISVMFMQISAPENFKTLANGIKTVVGGGTLGAFLISPMKVVSIVKTVAAHPIIAGIIALVGAGTQQINVAWMRSVTAGFCGDITVGTDARSGCSVVRVVKYDESNLRNFCVDIASIP